ncbi:ATP-dependent helicase [Bacillus sp. 03113]|uniref:ATP-dependent helicase n=1 Tax=Bacillus sp. 03113 TaxID=2578211 RepID=UPI0011422034|nr:UvrD-helicase domain-containing protein [Bacillus sp. 03113]
MPMVSSLSSITKGLNTNQHQAVVSTSPVILCLAGAGSGKTTVLTRRIAHLFHENRIGTSNMLALTFTRLAGKEMKERVIKLVGDSEGKKLFCNTFHAFAVSVLKDWGDRIGIEKNFTIYDQEDRASILTTIIDELGKRTTLKKVMFSFEISMAPQGTEERKVINEYLYRLRQNNAVDLEKLIAKVVELWKIDFESLQYYRRMYTHIFIDEYQDSNDEQRDMISFLSPPNLFVVGDDFQAIYGWRQAKVEYILNFPKEYPECEIIKLEDNYRSTKTIVAAANNLISHNKKQTKKKLIAHKDGDPITIQMVADERVEYEMIVKKVCELQEKGYSYKDIAILSRTNAQLQKTKMELAVSNIPNVLINNDDLMKNRDIRSIVAWLEVITNHKDNRALSIALRYPHPFLTQMEESKVKMKALEDDSSHLEVLHQSDFPGVKEFFSIGKKIFKTWMDEEETSVSRLFEIAADILGVLDDYKEKGLNNRIESFESSLNYIRNWEKSKTNLGEDASLSGFLKWLKYRDIHEKLIQEKDAVKLMTVHGSKGLEFPVVIMIGMVEEVFPSKKTNDLEEERRLAYVGFTRAKEKLILSYAANRQLFNGTLVPAERSRFIDEINA